jgi:hypothetical protein
MIGLIKAWKSLSSHDNKMLLSFLSKKHYYYNLQEKLNCAKDGNPIPFVFLKTY